ncbi:MAG TPA: prepilin-type N-terminal cleavage/methylation domain-containing protein [Vicinamibacterales bacterium]|nr:prepilin-type N-terminal cleavage/methylation domain-containing protein [Vicinamibacterales bacterium]
MNERGFSLVETLVVTVVLLLTLGIATQIFVQGNAAYATQRAYDDARSNAAAALDMMVRLLRSADMIVPDPDGNLAADSIRIVADWNPRNGTADPYEDVRFTTAGGILFKQEPADAAPVAFAERIASIVFTYRNGAGTLLATPWTATQAQLVLVQVTVRSTPINGLSVTMTSSASVRRRE